MQILGQIKWQETIVMVLLFFIDSRKVHLNPSNLSPIPSEQGLN